MSDGWLGDVLRDAACRRLCTRIHCGTCGAREFQGALLSALAQAIGIDRPQRLDARLAEALTPALCRLGRPDATQAADEEEAVRFILYRLWTGKPAVDQVLEQGLAGSWSGVILDRMKAHHAARVLAWQEAALATARGAERRAMQKLINQTRHAARLAQKLERDRLWHANHPAGS